MRKLVFAVLMALALVGCGVSTDNDPRNIAESDVPFDLLAPTSSTTSAAPMASVGADVYLLRSSRLVAVPRQVATPATVGTVLASLVQGPTSEEVDQGLSSSINQETRVLSAEVVDRTAVVNVSDAFSRIGVRDQISALAQVVYTATALPGVDRVQVMLDGAAVQVPRDDGTSSDAPLRRADYASFSPTSG